MTPADLDDGQSTDGHGDPTRSINHVDITQLNKTSPERLQVSVIHGLLITNYDRLNVQNVRYLLQSLPPRLSQNILPPFARFY